MMLGFLEAGYGNIVLAVICLLGVIGTWIAGRRYRRLTLQTDNISNTQSKYLKQIKNKFETSYRVNQGVNNVGLFVERNVQEFRFMGVKLQDLGNTAAGAGSLAFILGGGAALICYNAGVALPTVVTNLAVSMLVAAAALLYWKNANVKQKSQNFCVHMQEYLENVLSNRLAANTPRENGIGERNREKSSADSLKAAGMQQMSGYHNENCGAEVQNTDSREGNKQENESHREEIEYLRQSLDRIASGREPLKEDDEGRRKKPKFTPEEKSLIEDILREYFA